MQLQTKKGGWGGRVGKEEIKSRKAPLNKNKKEKEDNR